MNSLIPAKDIAVPSAPSKARGVKSYFEKPSRYLARQADIRIRTETVRDFSARISTDCILDVGCGDGSISIPLLTKQNKLTLLDFSSSMTLITRSNVPPELEANVDVRNENFMTANLNPKSYDLIICLGLLAHVDDPARFIGRIATLLKPGGHLILEFTDTRHFVGRMNRVYERLRSLRKRPTHSVNLLSFDRLFNILQAEGFRSVSSFRYTWWALPWIVSQQTIYRAMRLVYGTALKNRNAWLGHEYICLLTRE